MGKVRVRRQRGNRYNPTRVRNNNGDNNNGGGDDNIAITTTTTTTPGLNIVHEKLESVITEECLCGLNTLASLCLDNGEVIITQSPSLVDKVTHMLTHDNPEVRCAAAGTLRNLSVCGTDPVVSALTEPAVFTRVCVFLRTYHGGDWCPALTDLGQHTPTHLDPVTNALIHTTHVILNLCEYSDEAITQFNQENLLDILLQHLHPTFGVCVSAAECLLCVSENNPAAASVLLTHAQDALVARTRVSHSSSPQDLRFATTLVGVLMNINYSDNTTTSCQHILQTLATTLHPDPVLALQTLLRLAEKSEGVGNDGTMEVLAEKSDVGSSGVGNDGNTMEVLAKKSNGVGSSDNTKTNDDSTMEVLAEKSSDGVVGNDGNTMEVLAEKSGDDGGGVGNNDTSTAHTGVVTLQDLDHLITAQQLALELLSNICCPDDDDEEEEEEWDDDDGNESVMEEETTTTNIQRDNNTTLPPEIVEGLRFHSLFNTALSRTNALTHTLTQQATQHLKGADALLAKYSLVCVRALVCVQNLASVLDIEDMGGVDNVYTIWMNLASHTFNTNNTESVELLEAATGAMRGIMDTLSQYVKTTTTTTPPNITITQQDLQVILESGVSCVSCVVRGNLAHMVGTLGCLATHHDTHTHTHILNTITHFLFKVGANDPELWVSAEAIDSIIDIYSNDNTDNIANHNHLIQHLKDINTHFQAKVKQNKKVLGEHTALVLTVKDNITQFIKYKSKRLKKYYKK
ncbi:hypothetical protein Pmani_025673 [Petrolisthes manimaculis]|uniref:SYO1-like TPR repeats domain-containing protein n=1 Tax=Petrolisthes manimaculis TaxID=1843537 RepID=A0AAE1TXG1_9EUCA|nr:hypothetical protein Pmani_025673 [Petrolisthes manimaculis]